MDGAVGLEFDLGLGLAISGRVDLSWGFDVSGGWMYSEVALGCPAMSMRPTAPAWSTREMRLAMFKTSLMGGKAVVR